MNHDYGKGSFLIANPVLPVPNFSRSVVLLCNHDDQGSFGLVVNKTAELEAAEIFSTLFPTIEKKCKMVGKRVFPTLFAAKRRKKLHYFFYTFLANF